jgi:hypothetical protein
MDDICPSKTATTATIGSPFHPQPNAADGVGNRPLLAIFWIGLKETPRVLSASCLRC